MLKLNYNSETHTKTLLQIKRLTMKLNYNSKTHNDTQLQLRASNWNSTTKRFILKLNFILRLIMRLNYNSETHDTELQLGCLIMKLQYNAETMIPNYNSETYSETKLQLENSWNSNSDTMKLNYNSETYITRLNFNSDGHYRVHTCILQRTCLSTFMMVDIFLMAL